MAIREIYKDASGSRVPSVTTILSRFKDSGGLLYWANSQGLAGKTLDEARAPAADAGTMAHDMVEAHLNGRPMPELTGAAETIANARQAFDAYMEWSRQTSIQVRHTEVSIVSDVHKFGGRLDAIGLQDNRLVLLDWKTSNAVYAEYLLQIAAYAILWEESGGGKIDGFHLCRFAKEKGDFSHHYFPSVNEEKETFLHMRRLYDMVKTVEKRVR
jgi:hypothetical protein